MRFALYLVSAMLLAACGGSDGSSGSGGSPADRVELVAGMPGRDASASGRLDGPGTAARFSGPLGLTADRAGNLYVVDYGNHALRMITPQAVVSTLLVRDVPGEDLLGIAVDPAGALYFSVADCLVSADRTVPPVCHGALYRLSPALEAVLVTPQSSSDGSGTEMVYPGALAFDSVGNLYISDAFTDTCELRRLTPSGDLTRIASTCGGLAVATDATIYVAAGNIVKRVANGAVTVVAGACCAPASVDGPGPDARFASLGGIAIGPRGDLYVADTGNATVRKISPDGMVTTVAGTPTPELPGIGRFVPGPLPGELDHPYDVAIVGSDLYVAMLHSVAVVLDVP